MARLFDDGANEYLSVATPVIVARPYALACWFNTDSTTQNQTLISIGDQATDAHWLWLYIQGIGANQDIVFGEVRFGGVEATTTANYTANTWQHACGVAVSATERHAYLEGRYKGTNNVNKAMPGNLDATSIGRLERLTASTYMSGMIAEVVILRIVPTDYQVWLHAQGVPAPVVWPGWAIAAYYPLFDADRDFPIARYNMAAVNTPGWAPHPPKVLEWWRRYQLRAVATQTVNARIAPRVWVDWSPKGKSPAVAAAIMNQIQFGNLGADLYDGALM